MFHIRVNQNRIWTRKKRDFRWSHRHFPIRLSSCVWFGVNFPLNIRDSRKLQPHNLSSCFLTLTLESHSVISPISFARLVSCQKIFTDLPVRFVIVFFALVSTCTRVMRVESWRKIRGGEHCWRNENAIEILSGIHTKFNPNREASTQRAKSITCEEFEAKKFENHCRSNTTKIFQFFFLLERAELICLLPTSNENAWWRITNTESQSL